MAISKSTSTTLYDSYNNAYTLTTYFIENSTNVANNTSNITVRATLTSNGGSFSSSYNQTLTIQWWDSKTESTWITKATKTVTAMGTGATITAEATFDTTHLSDGTLRGQSKAIWTNNNGGNWCPASGEIKNPGGTALTTIPRASQPTMSAAYAEIGNNLTISTNRASSSFTHTITATFGSVATVHTIASNVGDSATFNTATWASYLKSAAGSSASVSVAFTCETFNGSTSLGTKTTNCTVSITPSVPTVSASSVEIGNAVTVSTNRLSTTSARTHTVTAKVGSTTLGSGTSVTTSWAFNTWSYVSALVSAGSGATVTFTCTTFVNQTNIGSKTVTATVTINPSVPTSSSFTVGSTVTVKTNRKSTTSARTHNLTMKSGSTTVTSVTDKSITTSWSLDTSTTSIANSIMTGIGTTAKSGTVTYTVTTYVNGTSIGSKTISVTATANTSTYKPTITFGTVSDTDSTAKKYHASGEMINLLSDLSLPITFGVTRTAGMALASAKVTFGGSSTSYSLSGTSATKTYTSTNVQTNTVTVTCTDARGTTVSATKTFTLIGYQFPVLTSSSVARTSMTGDTATFSLGGTAYVGTYTGDSSVTNSLTITYTVTPVGGSASSGATTYTVSLSGSGSRPWSSSETFSESFTDTQQYDIKFTIRDAFTTIYSNVLRLYNGMPVYGWGETHFDVYGDLHIHDRDDPSERWIMPDTFNAMFEHDGVKNLLPITGATTTHNGVTFTVNADGSVTADGTNSSSSSNAYLRVSTFYPKYTGQYTFSGCPNGGSASTYWAIVQDSSGTTLGRDIGDGFTLTLTANTEYRYYVMVYRSQTVSNITFYPMMRDARIASSDYVPYASTNLDLTASVDDLTSSVDTLESYSLRYRGTITTDLDSPTVNGIYRYNGSPSNSPGSATYGVLINIVAYNYYVQVAFAGLGAPYRRSKTSSGSWSSWTAI